MGSGITKPRPKPELLQCSICFNVYKVPRMLPCQHTFCEGCLHSYIMTTAVQDAEKNEFPCPMCRDVVQVPQPEKPRFKWAKMFPKNRLMISLFDGQFEFSDSCRLHPGKLIEFFCENHVEIGCGSCLVTRHKGCEVTSLDAYINSGKFKRACQKNNDMLQQCIKVFEDIIVEAGKNLNTLEKEKVAIVEEVKAMRASIEEMLKTMEDKLLANIDATFKAECDGLMERTERCRNVIVDIGNAVEQIAAAHTEIRPVQKAEIIVTVNEKLSRYGESIRGEIDTLKYVNTMICFDSLVENLAEKLQQIGELKLEKSEINFILPPFIPGANVKPMLNPRRHRNKHVIKISEHKVNGEGEAFFCNITSTLVLQDGRIVLCDDSNSKLKMLSGKFDLLFELTIDSNPLNMALATEEKLVVSIPSKRELTFVDIGNNDFKIDRNISTRLDCWGVDILENFIIITTGRDGHSMIVMDMKGKEVNSYLLTAHADENIRCPVSVNAERKTRLLYVTCTGGAWSKGCVICMDLQGQLIRVYQDPDIDTPRSCVIDRHGKIYICGLESSTVFQIYPSGDVYKIFPARNEEVVGPLHLNFIRNYHIRFLLTEVASDAIKVYELPTAK